MKEYDQKVLRKLQLAELQILKDFDALCRKHDIPYVLFYGSAIGAIRHGGFIPWDDDIDVILLREDYEKFVQVAETECSEQYYLLTAEKDSNYPFIAAQWGPKNTSFIISEFKNVPCKFTIFVDILPLDAISDNEAERKKQFFTAWFWQKLMLLRQVQYPAVMYRGLKKKIFHLASATIHVGMKILHISPKWLYKNGKKACLRYKGVPTKEVAFLTGPRPGMNIFLQEELFPPRYLEFEGVMLPCPNEIEKLLSRRYGDYMQLPPEDARKNHFPYLLDFGDGEVYMGEEKDADEDICSK